MKRTFRRAVAASAALVASLALSGCAELVVIDPWVVADHNAKVEYHAGAGDELLNLDATESLAKVESFQATGYVHIDTDANGSLHTEYLTSVQGESYVSRRVSDQADAAFDQSHQAGSQYTYFLLGDKFKKELADGKSWVQVPSGDLDRMRNPEMNCALYSVTYMCHLIDAWNVTQEAGNVPVQLSRSERGAQHFSTAVSYASLVEVGMIPGDGKFDGFLSEDARATLVPLHLWVAEDGIVTKVEVNGVITGDNDEQIRLQMGFEITARAPSGSMTPVSDDQVSGDDVYRITNRQQLDEFVGKLSAL